MLFWYFHALRDRIPLHLLHIQRPSQLSLRPQSVIGNTADADCLTLALELQLHALCLW